MDMQSDAGNNLDKSVDAGQILDTQSMLKSNRSQFENLWRDVARVVFPRMNAFDGSGSDSNSRKKTKSVTYSMPQFALTRFASAYDSMITPATQKWHALNLTNKDLENEKGVSEWLEEVRDILFRYRYQAGANFASQNYEKYISLGLFGTGVLAIDPNPKGGFIYKTHHINDHFLRENDSGRVDADNHLFTLKGYQALQRYGEQLPDKTYNDAQKKPMDSFEFLHVVEPNPDFVEGSINPSELKYVSHHVDVKEKIVFKSGGTNTFPYAISRYVTIPNDVYGTSPAMLILPDIQMANEMTRTGLVSKKLRGLPPVLTKHDGIISPAGGGTISAGKFIKGGLDAAGNPLMRPYISGSDPVVIDKEIDRTNQLVNDAFLVTLFQVLVDTPRMTAVEVMQRLQEKGALLAPLMGREQSESLSPQIEREIDILARQGLLPKVPDALAEADIDYDIVYTSPLSRAQKTEEANGVLRTVESAMGFAQADGNVLKRINFDAALKKINDANIGNTSILRTDEEVVKMIEAEQQQQAAMMLMEAAQAEAQGAGNNKPVA